MRIDHQEKGEAQIEVVDPLSVQRRDSEMMHAFAVWHSVDGAWYLHGNDRKLALEEQSVRARDEITVAT